MVQIYISWARVAFCSLLTHFGVLVVWWNQINDRMIFLGLLVAFRNGLFLNRSHSQRILVLTRLKLHICFSSPSLALKHSSWASRHRWHWNVVSRQVRLLWLSLGTVVTILALFVIVGFVKFSCNSSGVTRLIVWIWLPMSVLDHLEEVLVVDLILLLNWSLWLVFRIQNLLLAITWRHRCWLYRILGLVVWRIDLISGNLWLWLKLLVSLNYTKKRSHHLVMLLPYNCRGFIFFLDQLLNFSLGHVDSSLSPPLMFSITSKPALEFLSSSLRNSKGSSWWATELWQILDKIGGNCHDRISWSLPIYYTRWWFIIGAEILVFWVDNWQNLKEVGWWDIFAC